MLQKGTEDASLKAVEQDALQVAPEEDDEAEFAPQKYDRTHLPKVMKFFHNNGYKSS